MPPAARLGDSTAHGGVIGLPCADTVYIAYLYAARISDNHICPMVTGNVPHVGGMIKQGSLSVYIESLPAARKGDPATCKGGPPDTITGGAENVFIGG
jgi:uncharacterized Zn-binding protein involved in type VI secretion